jgi:hypothetical protein
MREGGEQGPAVAGGEPAGFRARVEDAIAADDLAALPDLLIEVGLVAQSREWAQSCCVQLARHRSAHVRGAAVLALGHLARRFGRLDPQRVRRLVEIALHDPNEHVRRQAAIAADDLATFLAWEFERPPA